MTRKPYIMPPGQRARSERVLYIPLVLTAFIAYLLVATSLYLIAPLVRAIWGWLLTTPLW